MNNQDQIDSWNGETGEKWATHSDRLDGLLAHFIPVILDVANLQRGERVLDIGCGAGALTLAAAGKIEGSHLASGVDVSGPLLEVARARAGNSGTDANFYHEDASKYLSAEPLDAVISRFGVMFFDKPVEAFSAIKRNLRPAGRLVFSCWQNLKDNRWAALPGMIAKTFMSEPLPSPDPNAPGPFAFADAGRIETILKQAGWQGIEIADWGGDIVLPGATLEESADFILQLGPVGRLLKERDVPMEPVRQALIEQLGDALNSEGSPALGGRAWIVSARAS